MVLITPEKRTKRMSSKVFQPIKEGKVREVYDNGDSLIIVATDRISAFDHILKNKVTKKGAILTQMSKVWVDLTKDSASSADTSQEAAGRAIKKTVPYAASNCRRDYRSPTNCLSRFLHRVPRQRSVCMMRISPLSAAERS